MRQTVAIFLDAYRSLNSKLLFWVVLGLSGLVVGCFACLGINEHGVTFLNLQMDTGLFNSTNITPEMFYKILFSELGIKLWLSWAATILALFSTAGIFPDLVTQGSIDLYVSRPISRFRLFCTQYLAGLLFVALQVTIFTVISFLIMGIRGGVWAPSLFWAVPIMVCFFSYLFSVCVLIGVWTRSALAALTLTILFWVFLVCIDSAEKFLLLTINSSKQVEDDSETTMPNASGGHAGNAKHDEKEGFLTIKRLHDVAYGLKSVFPKTSETLALLDRQMGDAVDVRKGLGTKRRTRNDAFAGSQDATVKEIMNRPVSWVVGTSLGFELVMLSLSAWIFCRRDY
jgi:ABC-type transport system involved in multi-copper enzyme maturation permease subunit